MFSDTNTQRHLIPKLAELVLWVLANWSAGLKNLLVLKPRNVGSGIVFSFVIRKRTIPPTANILARRVSPFLRIVQLAVDAWPYRAGVSAGCSVGSSFYEVMRRKTSLKNTKVDPSRVRVSCCSEERRTGSACTHTTIKRALEELVL